MKTYFTQLANYICKNKDRFLEVNKVNGIYYANLYYGKNDDNKVMEFSVQSKSNIFKALNKLQVVCCYYNENTIDIPDDFKDVEFVDYLYMSSKRNCIKSGCKNVEIDKIYKDEEHSIRFEKIFESYSLLSLIEKGNGAVPILA